MDLLKLRPIRAVLGSGYFPAVPQFLTLSAYAVLFAGSVGVGYDPRIAGYISSTNLASQIVWTFWWSAVLVLAAIAGRVWCAVCPLEFVNSMASRIGLKKRAPRLLRSGWVITLFYAFLLFGAGKYLGLHDAPRRLAIYLVSVFVLAIVLGLVYEKRSFCSYVCPLSSILGMYSYIAGMEWRADSPQTCADCRTGDCASKKNYYAISGHSCTSDLHPARIPDNRECLLCTHCMKACPNANFRLSLRMPFADFFKKIRLKPAEMCLLLLIIGFVNHNWHALVVFTLAPLSLCLVVCWKSWKPMLNAFMVLLIPVTAAAHMLHAFRGIIWNWPVLKFNFSDPLGVRTATMLADKALSIDRSGLGPAWELLGHATGLLYGAIFAASVAIILRSPLTEEIGPAGKVLLILSVGAYIASFYVPL